MKVKSFSRVGLFETPWTAAYQARVLEWGAIAFSSVYALVGIFFCSVCAVGSIKELCRRKCEQIARNLVKDKVTDGG